MGMGLGPRRLRRVKVLLCAWGMTKDVQIMTHQHSLALDF